MKAVKNFSVRTVAVVVSFIVFIVSIMSFSRFTADAVYESRAYFKYEAQTGKRISGYYMLYAPENTASTYGLIGTDERVEDWSKSGVVKLITTQVDGNGNPISKQQTCVTGFVIDNHTIATAAHCVYGYKVDNILFFDKSGNISMEITDPVEYHVPRQYTLYKLNDDDYALITVSQNLRDYACFNLGYVSDKFIGGEVSVTGFPRKSDDNEIFKDDDINTIYQHKMLTGNGNVTEFTENGLVKYTNDTSRGNSGSPVYVTEKLYGKEYYTVIAINVQRGDRTYNAGKRMTPEVLRFYKGNPNKQY
ncbi:MAG: serine protease [Ruminococcus sp.]|nr:serine protease [Ruminococcus sp.]